MADDRTRLWNSADVFEANAAELKNPRTAAHLSEFARDVRAGADAGLTFAVLERALERVLQHYEPRRFNPVPVAVRLLLKAPEATQAFRHQDVRLAELVRGFPITYALLAVVVSDDIRPTAVHAMIRQFLDSGAPVEYLTRGYLDIEATLQAYADGVPFEYLERSFV